MAKYVASVAVIDGVLISLSVVVAFILRTQVGQGENAQALVFFGPLILLPPLWLFLLWLRGVYDMRIVSLGTEEFRRIISGSVLLFAGVASISYLFNAQFSRFIVFLAIPIGTIAVLVNHRVARAWLHNKRKKGALRQNTILVGMPADNEKLLHSLLAAYQFGLDPTEFLSADLYGVSVSDRQILDDIYALCFQVRAEALVLAPSPMLTSELVRQLTWDPRFVGQEVFMAPQMTDVTGPRLTMQRVPGLPLIHLEEPQLTPWQAFSKRALDLLVSASLLVLLFPLLLIIALTITLTSRESPFFTQKRIGLKGHTFVIYKFRTMSKDADQARHQLREKYEQTVGTFKLENDPRVTSLGRWLRRWSLDELPQLVNVLSGAMSLVGPRPHTKDDVTHYLDGDEFRFEIKPGITGLQQVSGRAELSWRDSVRADIEYIENWTFVGDILILLRTIKAVVSGRGSY
ncbi:MAG: sugar transferase [Gammaproteobacteria bacterium]|nr:sugar transferase [Gammaproteobacteria bacterium]